LTPGSTEAHSSRDLAARDDRVAETGGVLGGCIGVERDVELG